MPLSKTFSKHVTHPRKNVFVSLGVGLLFFLLFLTIATSVTWHKRDQRNDRLANYTGQFVLQTFNELSQTLSPLLAWTQSQCSAVSSDLTARAAFTSNVRAMLLVRDGQAFCSSATGAMDLNIHQIAAEVDWDKNIDITLVPGTPMLPEKPAIVFWLKDPQHPRSGVLTTLNVNLTPWLLLTSREPDIAGMAIATSRYALSTWNARVVESSALPASPLRTLTLPGYPIHILLYGDTLADRDVHMILLAAVLLWVLASLSTYLLLSLRASPGKEILLGIKRGEFHVDYQPVVNARTGETYGLEALMRWTHPTEGRIPPDAFINYAEGQNLINTLTRHLFELVARDAQQLSKVLPKGTKLGVNLSPLHLNAPEFRTDVQNWIAAMPCDHFSYVFEITERTMVAESNAEAIFDWIHDRGIKIAIDDFGTGHSALIYLEKFKFDYLKIDRGFVQSIGRETVTSPVLDTVLNLARKLNLNTVAEGVETAAQANWLIDRGVTHLQGYFFSRPQSPDDLSAWLALQQPWPAFVELSKRG